jgi:recombination DNA repair RAD52 pathway protein
LLITAVIRSALAKVRVSVRAGEVAVVREGSGTGEGRASTPGQAHELALKGAETDATKRALATFGNSFGLALYDREQAGLVFVFMLYGLYVWGLYPLKK